MRRRLAIGAAAALAGWSWSRWLAHAAERQVPRDGRLIEVAGALLHVVELGEGPPVLMIHGLSGQLRNFSFALAERIAARGHRVILVDRPGYGYSLVKGARPGIRRQAAMMAELIGALGVKAPLVVGHSLGGAVALAMAVDHPAAVDSLALIAPLTAPTGRARLGLRRVAGAAPIRWAWAHLGGVPLARASERPLTAVIFAPEPVPHDFAVRGGGLLAMRPESMAQAAFEVTTLDDEMPALAARYGELTLPVAILAGRMDRVTPLATQAEFAARAIRAARLEIMAGGHMLPVTQPQCCADFIARAMAERPAIG